MGDDVITNAPRFSLSCRFDTVSIEIHCGDVYEARSLFDELAARLKRGEPITLRPQPACPVPSSAAE